MPDKKLSPAEVATNLEIIRHVPAWLSLRGLQRADIVNKLGTSDATVSKWFSGKQTMNGQQLKALARLLEIDLVTMLAAPDDQAGLTENLRFQKILEIAAGLNDQDIDTWLRMGRGMISVPE